MGMKFLNKKSWHPATFQNQERVWKAEQKHKDEEKKMAELQKQVREEREREEFRQLQIRAGVRPQQERLDFLYESGLGVGKPSDAPAAPSTQEYLLGKPVEETKNAEASGKDFSQPGAIFQQSDDPASKNDAWRKLHSDPLLAIKQQEQAALAKIKENPVQMMMLKQQAAEKKAQKKDEKRRAKEERRAERKRKREERKKRRRGGSLESDSESDSDDERPAEPVGVRREQPGGNRPVGAIVSRDGEAKLGVKERSPRRVAGAYEEGERGGRREDFPRPGSRIDDQARRLNSQREGGDRERGQPPPQRDGYDRRHNGRNGEADRSYGRYPDRNHHSSTRREDLPDRGFRGDNVRDVERGGDFGRRHGRERSPERHRRSPDRYRDGGVHRRGERSPPRTERGRRDRSPAVVRKRQRHDSSDEEPEPARRSKAETREGEKADRDEKTQRVKPEEFQIKREPGEGVVGRRRRHDSSESDDDEKRERSEKAGVEKLGDEVAINGDHNERDPPNGDTKPGESLKASEVVAKSGGSPAETGTVNEEVKREAGRVGEEVKLKPGVVSRRAKEEDDVSDDEPGKLRGYGLIPGRGGLQLPAKRTGDAPPVPYKKPEEPAKPPPRTKYVPGKLTEEEKARRLAEMQQDADAHESDRFHRLKRVAEKEEREDAAAAQAAAAKAAAGKGYLGDLEKSAYGLDKGGSVEDSIRRRSHFREKGPASGSGNAFRR